MPRVLYFADVAAVVDTQPISWGRPPQETQADFDETCPRCGARRDAEQDLNFDLRRNGVLRALCFVCGWAM